MGIKTQISRIKQNIANTYAVLSALGANMPDDQSSDNLAQTAGTAKAVLYSQQTLTDTQKAQARENVGAASAEEVGELSDNKADKAYLITMFGELKTALEESNLDAALAVLDKAILDFSALA